MALEHDLRACWSIPILSARGSVLGTFAMYYREPKGPTEVEWTRIEEAARLARIAIERKRTEQDLQESEERFRMQFEEAPVAYHEIDRNGILRRVKPAECERLGFKNARLLRET